MAKIAPLSGASSAVARGSQLALVKDAANMAWEVAWSSAMRARMSASYVMMIVFYGRERQWNYCTIMGIFVTSNPLDGQQFFKISPLYSNSRRRADDIIIAKFS